MIRSALLSLVVALALAACKDRVATTGEEARGGLPVRAGARPRTSEAPPGTNLAHQQLEQNAPLALQEALFQRAAALPDITVGPTLISVPGARAFHLNPAVARGPPEAFMARTELAHIHPPPDGSLHLRLPPALAEEVVARGWGERHPRSPRTLLVYGPRDDRELEVVWGLVRAAYAYARGGS